MIVKEYIDTSDERLYGALVPLAQIMIMAEDSDDNPLIMDFADTAYMSPVFVLSLIVLFSNKQNISFKNLDSKLIEIGVETFGIKPDQMRWTEFIAIMERYSSMTYIPIIDFPVASHNDEKENISSVVESIIVRQLNIKPNVVNGLKYMIEETLDNITEHSESERGYIFAQSYPDKGYLDICIADKGVTLIGSYRKLVDNEIATDSEAIKAANRGISSKNLPDAENRGYGIKTTKNMLVKGLEGQYMMISGSSFYYKRQGFDRFFNMPENLRWNGTLVAMRIPYISSQFNYVDYIE